MDAENQSKGGFQRNIRSLYFFRVTELRRRRGIIGSSTASSMIDLHREQEIFTTRWAITTYIEFVTISAPSMFEESRAALKSSRRNTAAVGRKRILIVEDDLPLRGMLSVALRRRGFQVLLAGDGTEAHRAIKIHQPNLMLLDLMMPGENGWDLLQKMQETGITGTIPTIVISAHLRVDPHAILKMGVTAILPKPFNLDELLDLVDDLAK